MIRFFLGLLLAAVLIGQARPFQVGSVAVGAIVIDEVTKKVADEIKKRVDLRPEGQRTVAISSMTCPTDLRATGGALLAKKLEDELKKRGLELRSRAAVIITGEYRDVSGKDPLQVEKANIQITLKDRAGKLIGEPIEENVDGLQALTLLFPGLVPPGKSSISVDPKMAVAKKTRIMASETGKFAVEVLVVDNPTKQIKQTAYKAVEARLDEGLARVDIKRNQAYAVRFHNPTDEDVAVELFIDGLSMFEFTEERTDKGEPKFRWVIVRKKSFATIRGWHINHDVSDLFYVTERDRSVAYSRMMLRDLGTITVRFHACWELDGPRPRDEPVVARPRDGSGTGVGHFPAKVPVKPRRVRVGVIRESIPVLYSRPER